MELKTITLDCGVVAKQSFYKNIEYLDISLIDLYRGYGNLNSFNLLSKLFEELKNKNFTSSGLSREIGYYDSTDDLILNVSKKIK